MESKSENTDALRGLYLARAFIDAQLDRPLNLDEISRRAHFSRYHFIRLFHKAFHETPYQYLKRRRIERAKEMLANSDLSVTEICFEVGFESLGSFSAIFHGVVGWSPSIYRARVLEQRRAPFKFIPGCFRIMYGLKVQAICESPLHAEERNFREARGEQSCYTGGATVT